MKSRTISLALFSTVALLMLPLESIATSNVDAIKKQPKYLCGISGRLLGTSAKSYREGQFLSGKGILSCRPMKPSNRDQTRHFAIHIKLIGIGRGIDLSVLRSTRLRSSGIGIHGYVEDLLGSYKIRKSNGAPLVKAGVDFDVPLLLVAHGRGSFELGLKGRDAARLGTKFHSMTLKIERSRPRGTEHETE